MAGYNNFIGYGYPNNMNYAYGAQPQAQGYFQQASGGYQQPQQAKVGIEWVDGEVGAKAFQLPQGWPANVPMPLWDTNDTVIYLKSINAMGMPNPLQKVRYNMPENDQSTQVSLPSASTAQSNNADIYVRHDEFVKLRDELLAAVKSIQADMNEGKKSKWERGDNNAKSSV